jgi:hypothetical protein
MFSRLAPRPCPECVLYLGTFAGVFVAIVMAIAAITFAWQPGTDAPLAHTAETGPEICGNNWPSADPGCRDKSADTQRSQQPIPTGRIEKTGPEAVAAPAIPAEAVETASVSQPATSTEPSAVAPPPIANVGPDASTVAPSDQAGARSRKNAERRSARERIRRERSFTGAGRTFDAVH